MSSENKNLGTDPSLPMISKIRNYWNTRKTSQKIYTLKIIIVVPYAAIIGLIPFTQIFGLLCYLLYQSLVSLWFYRFQYPDVDATYSQVFKVAIFSSFFQFLYIWILFFNFFRLPSI